MTWQSRVQNIPFEITTGDGIVYAGLWKNSTTSTKFNATAFNFINVRGTFVDRKESRSGRYPLVFWFQGQDNINQADAFDISSKDRRAWRVRHPFYGLITGHPLKITRDDTDYNVTKITVDFWETILTSYPIPVLNPANTITAQAIGLQAIVEDDFGVLQDLNPTQLNTIENDLLQTQNIFNDLFDNAEFAEYRNRFNVAQARITNFTGDVTDVLNGINTAILYPALLRQSVRNRLDTLTLAFDRLLLNITGRTDLSISKYFESKAAFLISMMVLASANPISTDYQTRSDISDIHDLIELYYTTYRNNIDSLSSDIAGLPTSYNASSTTQIEIESLVNLGLSNLTRIAQNSRLQRVFIVDKPTTLILLTHRLIGLDTEGNNIGLIKSINRINFNEMFNIQTGREIIYTV